MEMMCRRGCGACCIAPGINGAMPGMPAGKPAGVRCVHLNDRQDCDLWGNSARPAFCDQFKASIDVCGTDRNEALSLLDALELATRS